MTVDLTNKIHYFAKIDSTMLKAKEYIMAEQEIPKLIIAGEQTQGKGRFGRIWFSPKGNLSFTLIQTIQHPIEQIPVIVAVAAAEVLKKLIKPDFPGVTGCRTQCVEPVSTRIQNEELDPGSAETLRQQPSTPKRQPGESYQVFHRVLQASPVITLKSPNDVLVDGKKIGGILIEKWEPFYSIGIGINVASSPLIQAYETTCVHDYNRRVTNGFLLRCFLRRYDTLLQEDFGSIKVAYDRLLNLSS
jgi:biotin-(acetyl-CoA carboxylase) ligase